MDYLIDPDKDLPKDINVEDKAVQEQIRLISQLSDEDKKIVYQMIDKLLTNQKFKAFFKENVSN